MNMFLSPCQFQLTRHNGDEQCSAPSTLQNKTHLFTYALSKLSDEDFNFCLFNLLLYCLQNDFCDFMKRITFYDLLYTGTTCVLHNCRLLHKSYGNWRHVSARHIHATIKSSDVPRGGLGCSTPPPRNSEGPPKSCQTQPDCENCWKVENLGRQHSKMFVKKAIKF